MKVPPPANTRETLTRKRIKDFEDFLSMDPSRRQEALKRIAQDCAHPSAMSNFRNAARKFIVPLKGSNANCLCARIKIAHEGAHLRRPLYLS